MSNWISFFAGAGLTALVASIIWGIEDYRRIYPLTSSTDYREILHDFMKSVTGNLESMGKVLAEMRDFQSRIATTVPPSVQSALDSEQELIHAEGVLVAAIRSLNNTIDKSNSNPVPSQSDPVDYERVEKMLSPIASAIFRIAADTELSRKKFDVMAKVMGLDDRGTYTRFIQEQDEPDPSVFNEQVERVMREQGIGYKDACELVRSNMAHASRRW